jgi:NADH-quinone oxidoreductase subunit D
MNGDYLLAAAVEELAGIDVPERAQWLRMLALELSRLASHIWWWGEIGHEAGAVTPIFWALREREVILGLLELLSGHRWHHQWIVPGGVVVEPPAEFWNRLAGVLSQLDAALIQFEEFFSDNAIWVNRSEMIGTLEPDFAQANGASGPVLRGSGIRHDLRADNPYLFYGELNVDVPVGEFGDVLDRYRVRMAEIRESLRLVRRIRGLLPAGGPVLAADVPPGGGVEVPKGSCYTAVEGPRGELGLWAASDGGPNPVRLHLRSPSLYHVFMLDELCRGYLLADFFVIYGSLDVMVGEVDR